MADASLSDLFGKTFNSVNPNIAKVTVNRLKTSSTLVCDNLAGWPIDTKVDFSTYRLKNDGSAKVDPESQTDWKGVVSGNSITIERVAGAVDNGNFINDFVEMNPTGTWANDLIKGILRHSKQNGDLREDAVKTALGITGDTPPDWNPTGLIPTLVSSNGQKEYVINVPADMTKTLQPGTKVRVPRTTTVPKKSARFDAASLQYAAKSNPTGFSFTNNFTLAAHVTPKKYSNFNQGFFSRRQADTAGFNIGMVPNGNVEVTVLSGGAFKIWNTQQSLLLSVKTHVTATINLTTGVCEIYIDGKSVPVFLSASSGTLTSITQPNVDFRIGARKATDTGELFTGDVANVRIWSRVLTEAEINDYKDRQITTAPGLVANYPLSETWEDVSGNANHLIPSGGAINNATGHPFNDVEFGRVTKVGAFAAGVTPITVFTGRECSIPNEALGEISHSNASSPFDFPTSKSAWKIEYIYKISMQEGFAAGQSINLKGINIPVPTGSFDVVADGVMGMQRGASASGVCRVTLSSNATTYDPDYCKNTYHASNVANIDEHAPFTIKKPSERTSMSPEYIVLWSELGGTAIALRNEWSSFRLSAELNYT